jgi:hypothetical protein
MENTLKKIERDENGLIKGADYKFNELGGVDWRSMIPSAYLYPNKEKTAETDVSKLKDAELIITLAGIRFLAKLRGYNSYHFAIHNASEHYASVRCSIDWVANYETEGRPVSSDGVAGASFENTNDFARKFLIEIASNRSFCRAVREFLNISIVSQEELGARQDSQPAATTENKDNPHAKLEKALKEKGLDFDWLKAKLVESKDISAEINSITEIPKEKLLNIIERVQKFKPKKV